MNPRSLLAFGLLLGGGVRALGQTGLATVERMPVPEAVHRARLTGRLSRSARLRVSVSLAPSDPAGLSAFADRVSDPANPDYRRFLTPAQVGRRFGASEAKVNAVAAYLRSQGMSVTLVAKNRLCVLAEGTAAQAERAFDTPIGTYRATALAPTDREAFYANVEEPKLPASLAGDVVHIGGLDNSTRPALRSLSLAQTRAVYKAAALFDGGLRGEGVTLGISNFDGFRLSNLAPYYQAYGLPAPAGGVGSNVEVVRVGGGSMDGEAQGEGDLDLQMALGMAPRCRLIVYDGGSELVAVLAREANEDDADIITESYGWKLTSSGATAAHQQHLAMTAQGITYLAASGDDGTDFGGYDYPNYEPEVLMVGGTTVVATGAGARIEEVGWSGSGGGYSTNGASFNLRPSWQKGTGVPTTINRRLSPDLAIHAAGSGGAYPFFYEGKLTTSFVGTSFASPVLAGMLGLAIQKLGPTGYFAGGKRRFGRLQDLVYAQNGRPDVWFDVTSGSNGKLPSKAPSAAGAGWDTVTGWGAIDLEGFVAALQGAGPPPPPAKTYLPTSVGIDSSKGKSASGKVASLAAVDSSVYALTAVRSGTSMVASVKLGYKLPKGSAGGATLSFAVAGPAGATLQVFAYNVKAKAYDLLDTRLLTGTPTSFAATVGSLANYVTSAGALTLVERATVSTKGATAFVLKTDQATVVAP